LPLHINLLLRLKHASGYATHNLNAQRLCIGLKKMKRYAACPILTYCYIDNTPEVMQGGN